MQVNKEPAFLSRARNLASLIRKADGGEINENIAISKLGIAPRTWKAERVYFFDTHPEFSYDPEMRMIYLRTNFTSKKEQTKL